MVQYKFEAGEFFLGSPEVHVLKSKLTREEDRLYAKMREEVDGIHDRGLDINCWQREPSDRDRDGHLARLEGAQKLDAFLRALGKDKVNLFHHGKVCILSFLYLTPTGGASGGRGCLMR